ncbi:unnamed protein product [Didymodactylos carnosus]|uniref:Uncharacterized protein n=1 Tax=Didymodactylos carnosus TaxID=1234261 RepID=A0A814TZR0_9BILA|nr:unnamed protein product [Didymodactylos carnosus]CAF3931624.1 unnamed protein product [Didymodactylos carnosus]
MEGSKKLSLWRKRKAVFTVIAVLKRLKRSRLPADTKGNLAVSSSYSEHHHLETYQLLWLTDDENVVVVAQSAQSQQQSFNLKQRLRHIIHEVKLFNYSQECEEYIQTLSSSLENKDEQKIVLLLTEKFSCTTLIERLHNLRQISAFYIYNCLNVVSGRGQTKNEWFDQYQKVKGVFAKSEENQLVNQLKVDQCLREKIDLDSIGITVYNRSSQCDGTELEQRNAMFMYLQLFHEIILRVRSSNPQQLKNDLVNFLKERYNDNEEQLAIINEFEVNYEPKKAIWCYTRESCLYRILNKALRSLDFTVLLPFRFFIVDLHKQLTFEHEQQQQQQQNLRLLYRGQSIKIEELTLLRENIDKLIGFNSFLSTTTNRRTAKFYAEASTMIAEDLYRILFEFEIDSSNQQKKKFFKPFANITHLSHFHDVEDEVLISLGSIFQIKHVEFDDRHSMWLAKLKFCSDDDYALKEVLDYEKQRLPKTSTTLFSLLRMLINMGEYQKAKAICKQLFNESLENNDDIQEENCYFYFGEITRLEGGYDGSYDVSLENYLKCLEMEKKEQDQAAKTSKKNNDEWVAMLCSSIAEVYFRKKQYDLSLDYLKQALTLLPEQHRCRARIYLVMADVYMEKSEYNLSLTLQSKALEIQRENAPKEHSDIGRTYNNMGFVHENKENYELALKYYQESLRIKRKTLPSDHVYIKNTENNVRRVRELMGHNNQSPSLPGEDKK